MLIVIDNFSKKFWVSFLDQKGDVFSAFKECKIMIEKHIRKQVKCLCKDNELEFYSDEFNSFCRVEGTLRYLTVLETLQ